MGKRKQVADQCRAVAHMAAVLQQLYTEKARIYSDDNPVMDGAVDWDGERSHRLMNQLGDALNGMDAVCEEDEWTFPIFEAARNVFPLKDDQS